MKTRTLSVAVLVTASVGCHVTGAPDPQAGLGPTATVRSPIADDEVGNLHLEESGLWAYIPKRTAESAAFVEGQLVAFQPTKDGPRHLFAVVEVDAWGVRLQRLDTEPVELNQEGSFFGLRAPGESLGEQWGFCIVDGSTSSECLRDAPPGTRWHLYRYDDDSFEVAKRNRQTGRLRHLPVALDDIVAVGSLGTDDLAPGTGRFVAVRSAPRPRPTLPRIVAEPGCPSDETWTRQELPAYGDLTHPAHIEAAAWTAAADVLVRCDGDRATLFVPTLFRPGIEIAGETFDAAPLLGVVPTEVSLEAAPLAARAAGAIATGDWTSADLWLDRLVREHTDSDVDSMVLNAMSAIAAGGRPEAAVAAGAWAARKDWNPATSAAWILGMGTAERELGSQKGAFVRTRQLPELLDRSGNETLRGYLMFHRVRQRLQGRDTVGDLLEKLEPYPLYRLLARAEFAARTSPGQLGVLAAEFDAKGARPLLDILTATDVAMPCPSTGCIADVYGRFWASGALEPEALSRVGLSLHRPGYVASRVAEGDDWKTLRSLVALYPLVDAEERADTVDLARASAERAIAASCGKTAPAQQLGELRRIGIDAALRMEDWELLPLDATMAWLAIRGVPAACDSPEELVARASELAERIGASSVPAALLDLWVERATSEDFARVLESAASYASRYERGGRCASWNLALAARAAVDGRIEDARRYMSATDPCQGERRGDLDIVHAYLNFQKTGRVSADFDEGVRTRLAQIVHQKPDPNETCVGASQLEYHLLPILPEETAELVMRLPPDPAPVSDDLTIVDANDRLLGATESLADVRTAAVVADWKRAAAKLGHANEALAFLGHATGIARVRLVDDVMFAGQAAKIAAGEVEATDVMPAALVGRRGSYEDWVAPESPEPRVVDAILRGDEAELRAVVEASQTPRISQFCKAPDRTPRGTVLDRTDEGLEVVDPNREIEIQ